MLVVFNSLYVLIHARGIFVLNNRATTFFSFEGWLYVFLSERIPYICVFPNQDSWSCTFVLNTLIFLALMLRRWIPM
jgi:hypothetical protein